MDGLDAMRVIAGWKTLPAPAWRRITVNSIMASLLACLSDPSGPTMFVNTPTFSFSLKRPWCFRRIGTDENRVFIEVSGVCGVDNSIGFGWVEVEAIIPENIPEAKVAAERAAQYGKPDEHYGEMTQDEGDKIDANFMVPRLRRGFDPVQRLWGS